MTPPRQPYQIRNPTINTNQKEKMQTAAILKNKSFKNKVRENLSKLQLPKLQKSVLSDFWIRLKTLGITSNKPAEVMLDLNRHFVSLFVLFHQYEKHYFALKAIRGHKNLADFLKQNGMNVRLMIDRIGERMAELKVIPTAAPRAQSKLSYIRHEPERRFTPYQMVALDKGHETIIFGRLMKTVQKCMEIGDKKTAELLLELADEIQNRIILLNQVMTGDRFPSIQQKGQLIDLESRRAISQSTH